MTITPLGYRRRLRTTTPNYAPAGALTIDGAHPLAQGLTNAIFANEGGGGLLADAVTGRVLKAVISGGIFPAWQAAIGQPGMVPVGDNATYSDWMIDPFSGSSPSSFTFVVWYTIHTSVSAMRLVCTLLSGGASTTGLLSWDSTNNRLQFTARNTSNTGFTANGITTINALDTWHAAAVTFDKPSGVIQIYNAVAGQALSVGAGSSATLTGTARAMGRLALLGSGVGSALWSGLIGPTLFYNRVLGGAEMDMLSIGGACQILRLPPRLQAFEASDTNVTGTGAVTLAHPALSATGTETMSGTGAPSLTVPALSATGTETFTGTGAVTIAHPTLSASGFSPDVYGPAAVSLTAPALVGTGAETMSGTGGPSLTAPALSGTGTETFSGTGAVTIGHPTLSGAGSTPDMYGPAAVTIAHPTLSGSGGIATGGAVAMSIGAPALGGSGLETLVDHWASIREGDIIKLVLPHASFAGRTVLARVMARQIADGTPHMELELQIIEQTDAQTMLRAFGDVGAAGVPPVVINTNARVQQVVPLLQDQVADLQRQVALQTLKYP